MKYLAYLIAALLAEAIAIPAAFFLPLAALGQRNLPSWLSWFSTPDNDLDGDDGWLFKHWQWRYRLPYWLCSYIGRAGWLLRNRAYGFKWTVLAAPIRYRVTYVGDLAINRARPGLLRCWCGQYWQWKLIHPLRRWHLAHIGWWLLVATMVLGIPCLLLSGMALLVAAVFARDGAYCWMLNFGWLLDDFVDGESGQPKALFLFSPRITKINRKDGHG